MLSTLLLIFVDLCCRPSASTSATCSKVSAYSWFRALQPQHIDYHISKMETLDHPPTGGKVRYYISAFWQGSEGLRPVPFLVLRMGSLECPQEIGKFTSSAEPNVEHGLVEVPEVLQHLAKKGVKFDLVQFWGLQDNRAKLVRNHSIYFSVDTIVTSQEILVTFDKAGVDVDEITCIQRKASNKSWVVTFDSQVTKKAALEATNFEINGTTVFLGSCEHCLVLVKIYEAPAELPDMALIGHLSHYGGVLSYRRDKIADNIESGM